MAVSVFRRLGPGVHARRGFPSAPFSASKRHYVTDRLGVDGAQEAANSTYAGRTKTVSVHDRLGPRRRGSSTSTPKKSVFDRLGPPSRSVTSNRHGEFEYLELEDGEIVAYHQSIADNQQVSEGWKDGEILMGTAIHASPVGEMCDGEIAASSHGTSVELGHDSEIDGKVMAPDNSASDVVPMELDLAMTKHSRSHLSTSANGII